jgi:hypothetical protein
MITATLLASIGIALAPQDSMSVEDLPQQVSQELSVSLHLEETRFTARSFAAAEVLMIVSNPHHGILSTFWLPSGATYIEEFQRGTLEALRLEMLSIADGEWITTGHFFLGDFMPHSSGELWALNCGHVLTQTAEGAPLSVATPAGSLLPPELLEVTNAFSTHRVSVDVQSSTAGAPLHVPVPTPTDVPKDTPPRKRHKQLPPLQPAPN